MKFRFFTLTFAASQAIAVLTTSLATGSENCAAISDAASRLACFDKVSKSAKKVGATDPFAAIKSEIAKTLKDLPSAIFSDLSRAMRPDMQRRPKDTVCGSVNAKNSYGGYTGAQKFVYFPENNMVQISGSGTDGIATIIVQNFCK